MRIAIFHNFMDNIGGAEIVDLILARELNADIYTTNINREYIAKSGFEDVLPRIYSIGKVPINPPFRQEMTYIRFKILNLNKYQKKYDIFIIGGDWAIGGSIHNKPNVMYVNSHFNEFWHKKDFIITNVLKWWQKPLFEIWVLFNKLRIKKTSLHVQRWIVNSENTKEIISIIYGNDSRVIYPPIYTENYKSLNTKNYWLSVNRLVNYKRVELQTKAFERLPKEKLIIASNYENSIHHKKYAKYIFMNKPKNVEIINRISKQELNNLYAHCKGFITTALEEDFGITPIEAMASGKPVIAPNEGGYKETIIDGKTGILIDDINPEKIINAIKIISNNPKKYKKNCINRSKIYDTKVFINKIKEEISKIVKNENRDPL